MKTSPTQVRLTDKQRARCEKIAKRRDCSISEVVREAIDAMSDPCPTCKGTGVA